MTNNNNKINTVTKVSNSSIIKRSLKFFCWNIQAPSTPGEGSKFKIDEFINILQAIEIQTEIHFPGNRSHCIPRKNQNSGGVGILMKNVLLERVPNL